MEEKEEKTSIERLAKRKKIEWIKKYDKDDIVIYEDPTLGTVRVLTHWGVVLGKDAVAIEGIVVFGKSFSIEKGVKPFVPYILKSIMDTLRGQ